MSANEGCGMIVACPTTCVSAALCAFVYCTWPKGPRRLDALGGDSLLVSDGVGVGVRHFWVCNTLSGLPLGYVRYWCVIGIFLGLLMRKFDKMSVRLSFSPKYCRALAKYGIKPLVLYHEYIFGVQNDQNLVYLLGLKNILCLNPRHMSIEVPLGLMHDCCRLYAVHDDCHIFCTRKGAMVHISCSKRNWKRPNCFRLFNILFYSHCSWKLSPSQCP